MKRGIASLLALGALSAWPSLAAVTLTEDVQVNLLRGTAAVSTHVSWDACMAEARRLANAANQTSGTVTYTCQTERRRVIAAYRPNPVPVNCAVSAWGAWQAGPWSACANGTQSRTETRTRTITTPAANGGAACPVLTETRSVSQACSVAPPATTWTLCANEGGQCAFTGTRRVRYGAGTAWAILTRSNGVACNNSVFGDPIPNTAKRCEMESVTTPPPPPPPLTFSVPLRWDAPTTKIDGSPAGTISGYRLSYGPSATELNQVVTLGSVTRYRVEGLAAGNWYFGVQAISSGTPGQMSNIVSKTNP